VILHSIFFHWFRITLRIAWDELQMKGHFVFLASINASLGFPETPVSKEIK
jgi:hypothetical protein